MRTLLTSAELDNDEAQMILGFCLYHGIHFKISKSKALHWIKQSANLGNA